MRYCPGPTGGVHITGALNRARRGCYFTPTISYLLERLAVTLTLDYTKRLHHPWWGVAKR